MRPARPCAKSRVVAGRGAPPSAGTTDRLDAGVGVNTMASLVLHEAPRHSDPASHNTVGAPPEVDTLNRRPLAKKPIQRPSGEKNGEDAPSERSTRVDSRRSIGLMRSQLPSASRAT
jgi:hypothetical protein